MYDERLGLSAVTLVICRQAGVVSPRTVVSGMVVNTCSVSLDSVVLGGLTIYDWVVNFLQCICDKNYENWLAVDKVSKNKQAYFFGPP